METETIHQRWGYLKHSAVTGSAKVAIPARMAMSHFPGYGLLVEILFGLVHCLVRGPYGILEG